MEPVRTFSKVLGAVLEAWICFAIDTVCTLYFFLPLSLQIGNAISGSVLCVREGSHFHCSE